MHFQRTLTQTDVRLEPGGGSCQEHSTSNEQPNLGAYVPRMLLDLPFGIAPDDRGADRNVETSAVTTALKRGLATYSSGKFVARLLDRCSPNVARAAHSRYAAHRREPTSVTRRSTRLESVGRFEGLPGRSQVVDSARLLDEIASTANSAYAAADPRLGRTFPSKRPRLHRILELRRRLFPSPLPPMIRPDQVSRGYHSMPISRN
jgi:hypothetical protein